MLDASVQHHGVMLIKLPARDACLYMGPFGFPSNLAGLCTSPGEFFGICCSDISTNQRGHMTKNVFFFDG